MKLKKSFFITFLIIYIIIGYFSQLAVQVKWNESATLLTRFLFKAEIAFIDGWVVKVIIALIFAVVSNIISNKRAEEIASIYCMLIAIILMATPYGIAMTLAPSPTERVAKYFSYFSMILLGYGNWFPAITALLSVIVFFLFLVGSRKASVRKTVIVCVTICIISSVLSWLLFNSISGIGTMVVGFHIIVLVVLMQ